MSLVEEYHAAHKARQHRIAQSAANLQSRKQAIADAQQSAVLERYRKEQEKVLSVRRQYETAGNALAHAPITWRILRALSEEFDMPVSDILGRKQTAEYTLPRYVAIGLMLQLTNMSLPGIGQRIGGRDHTTVINGKKRIAALLEEEAFRNRFEQIKAEIAA
jgi:chromosomal replication initiation ATPase DnaA